MGKKSKILYWTVLIVNIVCFVLDLLPINFPFFRISFAVSLILIGLLLFVRAVTLKIDSSMCIGTILFICGVLNAISYFGQVFWNLNINQLWPYYLFAIAFGCLITAIYFKDKVQMRFSILFLGFGLITLLFVRNIVVLWLFIVLMVVWFVGYFVVNLILAKRSK